MSSNVKNRVIYNEFKDEDHCYNFVLYDADVVGSSDHYLLYGGASSEQDFDVQLNLSNHDVRVQVKSCALSLDNFQILAELFSKKPKVRLAASTSFAGIVSEVGPSVTTVKAGDRVAGILPLDSDSSACSDACVINEFNLVLLPEAVDFDAAAACIGDGAKAYVALHYLGRLEAGDTVMILDAATGFGSLAVQLAHAWGAKVLAVVSDGQERSYLQKMESPPSYVIEVDSKSATLVGSVMEETGKLGVDVIIDNGVRQFITEEDKGHSSHKDSSCSHVLPTKHDIISCLAVGGRWVTSQPELQLDPPNSLQLFMRSASISFLFEQSWTLSASRQGRWLHIVEDIMKRLELGTIKPHITRPVPFSQAMESLEKLNQWTFGKTVVQMT